MSRKIAPTVVFLVTLISTHNSFVVRELRWNDHDFAFVVVADKSKCSDLTLVDTAGVMDLRFTLAANARRDSSIGLILTQEIHPDGFEIARYGLDQGEACFETAYMLPAGLRHSLCTDPDVATRMAQIRADIT
jgi:hypothetical protein